MSFYIIDIVNNGNNMITEKVSSIGKAVDFADQSSILGDTVTIYEAYEAADGHMDFNGVLMEWQVS